MNLISTPPEGHSERVTCDECNGTGLISKVDSDGIHYSDACEACDGDGTVEDPDECECAECKGDRREQQERADERAQEEYERRGGR